jgi:hypothetical protein
MQRSKIFCSDRSFRNAQVLFLTLFLPEMKNYNTGCNGMCTNLKIYCDQTNSNITAQFVIECENRLDRNR